MDGTNRRRFLSIFMFLQFFQKLPQISRIRVVQNPNKPQTAKILAGWHPSSNYRVNCPHWGWGKAEQGWLFGDKTPNTISSRWRDGNLPRHFFHLRQSSDRRRNSILKRATPRATSLIYDTFSHSHIHTFAGWCVSHVPAGMSREICAVYFVIFNDFAISTSEM